TRIPTASPRSFSAGPILEGVLCVVARETISAYPPSRGGAASRDALLARDLAATEEVALEGRGIDLDAEARTLRDLDHAVRSHRGHTPQLAQGVRGLVVLEPGVRHRRVAPVPRDDCAELKRRIEV